jgi:uncharacterized protein HemX
MPSTCSTAVGVPRARRSEKAHYVVATRYSAANRYLSYAVVIIAAVTGSGLFATLSNQNTALQFSLAALSLLAAAIAGYQRSAQFAARSVEHHKAGASWGEVVNAFEALREELNSREPTDKELEHLRHEMDRVTTQSPQIPQRAFRKFEIGQTYFYRDRR